MDAGADDYVAKPFHMEEVLARIRAQVRRASGPRQSEIECGPLRLDTKTARVTVDGQPIKLTSHEYRLLAYLMHHNERVVSRTELVEHLYEQDFDRDSNTIEVFIGRLRKKIPVDMIKTVRGLGYRLSDAKAMRINSLAFRLFATAAAWTLWCCRSPAHHLSRSTATSVERSFDAPPQRLSDQSRRLDARQGGATQPHAPTNLGEPLFEITLSGWYWQIKPLDGSRAADLRLATRCSISSSRCRARTASPPTRADAARLCRGPQEQRLRIVEREITARHGPQSTPYSYAVAGDAAEIDDDSRRLPHHADRGAGARGIGLLAVTLVPGPLRAVAAARQSARAWRPSAPARPSSSKASCPPRSSRCSRSSTR